jgi:hypothetical protein
VLNKVRKGFWERCLLERRVWYLERVFLERSFLGKQSCQVSRFTRESPGFRADLQVSQWVLKISQIPLKWSFMHGILHLCSEKIQFAKILSVLSKENPYVFVKWHSCQ